MVDFYEPCNCPCNPPIDRSHPEFGPWHPADSSPAYDRMSESPEDVRREESGEEDKEEDAPVVADEKEKDEEEDEKKDADKDEDIPDAEEEHANGVDDKEKDEEKDDRSPSPRARSVSRDASRSPDSRSPVRAFCEVFVPVLSVVARNFALSSMVLACM